MTARTTRPPVYPYGLPLYDAWDAPFREVFLTVLRTFRARYARFAHVFCTFCAVHTGGVTIGSGVSEGRRWSGLRPQQLKLAENVGKWVVIISGGLRGIFEASKCSREERMRA